MAAGYNNSMIYEKGAEQVPHTAISTRSAKTITQNPDYYVLSGTVYPHASWSACTIAVKRQ